MIDVFDNTCNCILQYEDKKFPFLKKALKSTADKYSTNGGNAEDFTDGWHCLTKVFLTGKFENCKYF